MLNEIVEITTKYGLSYVGINVANIDNVMRLDGVVKIVSTPIPTGHGTEMNFVVAMLPFRGVGSSTSAEFLKCDILCISPVTLPLYVKMYTDKIKGFDRQYMLSSKESSAPDFESKLHDMFNNKMDIGDLIK